VVLPVFAELVTQRKRREEIAVMKTGGRKEAISTSRAKVRLT
jgi:hypothetical protein